MQGCGAQSFGVRPESCHSHGISAELNSLRAMVEASHRSLGQMECKLSAQVEQTCRRHLEPFHEFRNALEEFRNVWSAEGPLQEFKKAVAQLQAGSRQPWSEMGNLEPAFPHIISTVEARVGARIGALEQGVVQRYQAVLERIEGRRGCLERLVELEQQVVVQSDVKSIVDGAVAEVRKMGPDILGKHIITCPSAMLDEVRTVLQRVETKVNGCESKVQGFTDECRTESTAWRGKADSKLENFERSQMAHSQRLNDCEVGQASSKSILEQVTQDVNAVVRDLVKVGTGEAGLEIKRVETTLNERFEAIGLQVRDTQSGMEKVQRASEEVRSSLQLQAQSTSATTDKINAIESKYTLVRGELDALRSEFKQEVQELVSVGIASAQKVASQELASGLEHLRADVVGQIASIKDSVDTQGQNTSETVSAFGKRCDTVEALIESNAGKASAQDVAELKFTQELHTLRLELSKEIANVKDSAGKETGQLNLTVSAFEKRCEAVESQMALRATEPAKEEVGNGFAQGLDTLRLDLEKQFTSSQADADTQLKKLSAAVSGLETRCEPLFQSDADARWNTLAAAVDALEKRCEVGEQQSALSTGKTVVNESIEQDFAQSLNDLRLNLSADIESMKSFAQAELGKMSTEVGDVDKRCSEAEQRMAAMPPPTPSHSQPRLTEQQLAEGLSGLREDVHSQLKSLEVSIDARREQLADVVSTLENRCESGDQRTSELAAQLDTFEGRLSAAETASRTAAIAPTAVHQPLPPQMQASSQRLAPVSKAVSVPQVAERVSKPAKPSPSAAVAPAVQPTQPPGASLPTIIRANSPNWQQECTGVYTLVVGETANGRPLWRKADGERWIYFNLDGRWTVGGPSENEKLFNCNNGYMFNAETHPTVTPDKLTGKWTLHDGANWVEDPAVSFTTDQPNPQVGKAPVALPGLTVAIPSAAANPRASDLKMDDVSGGSWDDDSPRVVGSLTDSTQAASASATLTRPAPPALTEVDKVPPRPPAVGLAGIGAGTKNQVDNVVSQNFSDDEDERLVESCNSFDTSPADATNPPKMMPRSATQPVTTGLPAAPPKPGATASAVAVPSLGPLNLAAKAPAVPVPALGSLIPSAAKLGAGVPLRTPPDSARAMLGFESEDEVEENESDAASNSPNHQLDVSGNSWDC